jgi:hypothetical protein
VHGQVLYGSLTGTVRDATNAPVPGAAVRITNASTNQSRDAVTNESGEYSFPSLDAGIYDVTVTREGFQTYAGKGVHVDLDQTTRMDAALKVGAVSESVVVSGEAITLQTDSAQVRSEVESVELENVPIPINRNFESLLIEIPGITPPENANSGAANPSRGLTFSAAGTPRNMNNVRIEGASANNVWLPYVVGYVPGLEAIGQVSVVAGTFDASQGLAGGAAVNVNIKSGTNQIHGSAFWYQINNAWGARAFFQAPEERNAKFINNVGGGTVGGPIRKDKLFYFLSFDGHFLGQNAQSNTTVATPEMRTGNFSLVTRNGIYDPSTGNADGTGRTPFPDNIIPAARLSSIALKMQQHVPLPNETGTSNNYFATGDASQTRDTTDAKVDWRPGGKLSVAQRLGWLYYDLFNPPAFGDNGPPLSSSISRPGSVFGNVWSTTSTATYLLKPTFVIDGYFSITTQGTSAEPPAFGQKLGLDYLGIPGTNGPTSNYTGWPYFNISSYSTIGTAVNSSGGPLFYSDRQYQYAANGSWSKGTHSVRFGGEVSRQHFNHFENANGFNGQFAFTGGPTSLKGGSASNQYNNYATFLLGLPTTVYHDLLPFGNLVSHQWIYGLFVQDAWRATGKLSISAGLRWTRFPLATRDNGRGLERYDFTTNQVELCGVGTAPRDCGYHVGNKSFSPNVGIAYRATGSLVVRTGFGLNFDPAPLAYNRDMLSNYPEILAFNFTGANTFQPATTLAQGIPPLVAPDVSKPFVPLPPSYNMNTLLPNPRRDYVLSWNVTLQKEFPKSFVGSAGYVASRAVGVPQLMDQNISQLGAGPAGQPYNILYGTTAVLNLAMPLNHTHYDSLQTQLYRRLASGGLLRLGYTFSKNTGLCCNDISDTAPAILLPQYMPLARSLEPNDRTHHFTASWVVPSPFGRGKRWLNHGIGAALAGGWRLNALAAMTSGKPFNVTGSTTPLNSNGVGTQRPDLVKPDVAILGGIGTGHPYFDTKAFAVVNTARIGTAGYEILRGPSSRNLDTSLFRDFAIRERYRLQIRAEALNVTNTPHFNAPSGNASSSGFGFITSTTGYGREGIDQRMMRFGARLSF